MKIQKRIEKLSQVPDLELFAILDLGNEKIPPQWRSYPRRVEVFDIHSFKPNPADTCENEIEFCGSSDGYPAMLTNVGTKIAGETYSDSKGVIYCCSNNGQYFGGWTAKEASLGTDKSEKANVPVGFYASTADQKPTCYVKSPFPGDIYSSKVLALSNDGKAGGNYMLRPFIVPGPGEKFIELTDIAGEETLGGVTGVVDNQPIAVGVTWRDKEPNSNRAVIWTECKAQLLNAPAAVSSVCRGCTADGEYYFGSIQNCPTIWKGGEPLQIFDRRGKTFTGETQWVSNGCCGGTGLFRASEFEDALPQAWIAVNDERRATTLADFVRVKAGFEVPMWISGTIRARSFGERLLIVVRAREHFS